MKIYSEEIEENYMNDSFNPREEENDEISFRKCNHCKTSFIPAMDEDLCDLCTYFFNK